MNWKTRQLFSDREHGIVSGLSPVNMMGGGSVPIPGYQDGGIAEYAPTAQAIPISGYDREEGGFTTINPALFEGAEYAPTAQAIPISAYDREGGTAFLNTGQTEEPSIEQRVAELAAKMGISVPEARAMILTQMIEEKGLTLSEEVINQFATGVITLQEALAQAVGGGAGAALREGVTEAIQGMQAGTGLQEAMSIDLFQQGDEDINEALNTSVGRMSGAISPNVTDISVGEPTEIVEERITLTEDQGPITEESTEYEIELQGIKEQFEELLRRYATKLAEANGTIEQLIEQAKSVELAFSNKVTEIQAKYNIEGLDETLLTEEFMQELTALIDPTIPGMQNAGVVHSQEELIAAQKLLSELGMNISPQRFLDLPEKQRKKFINAFTILAANRGITSSSVGDRTKLDKLLERREGIAGDIGKAARSSYSSSLPRILHYGAAKSAGELAEAGAMDKTLADQISAERALLSAGGRGASSMGRLPAALIEDIYGDTGDLSAAYQDMIDALKKGGKQANLELVDVMFMERYQQMPPDQTAYQGTKDIGGQTVTFPQFYALTRRQEIAAVDKEPSMDYEYRKIEALKRIFRIWINSP